MCTRPYPCSGKYPATSAIRLVCHTILGRTTSIEIPLTCAVRFPWSIEHWPPRSSLDERGSVLQEGGRVSEQSSIQNGRNDLPSELSMGLGITPMVISVSTSAFFAASYVGKSASGKYSFTEYTTIAKHQYRSYSFELKRHSHIELT